MYQMDYDAIIVGGGLGGLSAGAILARQGKKVLLLEQHYIPGGCATTFKRKDFIMEVGLHAMDGHLINQESQRSVLRFLGVKKNIQFLPLPEFFRIKNQHIDFVFPRGSKNAMKALISAYPGEEAGIRKFFSIIMGVQQELSRFPKKTWRRALVLPLSPLLFPNIIKTLKLTVGKCLDRYIDSEDLKLILQGNLLYYHDDPYSMSMAFFAKAQASFIHNGGYFIRGGSQKLSDSLAEVIRSNHGTLLLGKKVTQILISKGKAVGVSFSDAFNHRFGPVEARSNHVIFSGAIPLVTDLVTGNYKSRIERKINKLVPSCSLLCVYMGFKKEVKHLNHKHYSTFIYGNDVRNLKSVLPNNYGDWNTRNFVFVDYGQIDSGLAPEGKSFGVICAADRISDWEGLDDREYRKKKEEIAEILMGRLEQEIPGITDLIEYYDVGTSKTIRRYTLNPFGSPYGYAQLPGQAGMKRPSNRSPVKNLWFAGTWTFPGGGFTGAIVSGFLCGLQVNKRLKKEEPKPKNVERVDQRTVRLVEKEEIAKNTIALTFEKPAGFDFQPGQFAILHLTHPAYAEMDMPLRPLTISSHPVEEGLRFILRKSSSSFKRSCDSMQPGETATIYGPDGDFTLKNLKRGLVFLVSGIGISPIIPFLKELVKRQYDQPVYLFYSNRTEEEASFHRYIQSVDLQNFHYKPVFTGTQERISGEMIIRELSDPGNFEYYIVGASGFLYSMTGILGNLEIPQERIHTDDFG